MVEADTGAAAGAVAAGVAPVVEAAAGVVVSGAAAGGAFPEQPTITAIVLTHRTVIQTRRDMGEEW